MAVEPVHIAQGGGRSAFAFVALLGADDVAVVFRGSVLPLNYEDDEDVLLTRKWWVSQHPVLQNLPAVHQGFLRSYASIQVSVFEGLRKALALRPNAAVYVCCNPVL